MAMSIEWIPLRVMSFNLAWGYKGGLGQDKSHKTQAEYIKQRKADIVFLQEVDRNVGRSGRTDQPAILSQLTGLASYAFVKHQNLDGGEYGVAVLSKYQLTKIQAHRIPWPAGWWLPWNWSWAPMEMSIMTAEINIAGKPVSLVCNHWPSDDDKHHRQPQRMEAAKMAASFQLLPNVIFAGDLNAVFATPEVELVLNALQLQNAATSTLTPPTQLCRPIGSEGDIDQIFFRGNFKVLTYNSPCETITPPISDHAIPEATLNFDWQRDHL
jgi:endonuclease/exonuclease/phosphatase family metal-dependent hydrolase